MTIHDLHKAAAIALARLRQNSLRAEVEGTGSIADHDRYRAGLLDAEQHLRDGDDLDAWLGKLLNLFTRSTEADAAGWPGGPPYRRGLSDLVYVLLVATEGIDAAGQPGHPMYPVVGGYRRTAKQPTDTSTDGDDRQ